MKRGFTLIELLICITIMSIIAAILFPLFQRIKIQSSNAISMSNIRQLGIAWKLYSQDHDDYVMNYITSDYNHWFGNSKSCILDPYINIKKIKDPLSIYVNSPSYWVGYGYNGIFMCREKSNGLPEPINYSEIQNPSQTVVFAPVAGLFRVNSIEALYPVSILYPPSLSFPTFHARYNGKAPVLWADLHTTNQQPIYLSKLNYKKYNLGYLDADSNLLTDELFDLE